MAHYIGPSSTTGSMSDIEEDSDSSPSLAAPQESDQDPSRPQDNEENVPVLNIQMHGLANQASIGEEVDTQSQDVNLGLPVDLRMCTICQQRARNTTFFPCAHFATCAACAGLGTHCPICQRPYQEYITGCATEVNYRVMQEKD